MDNAKNKIIKTALITAVGLGLLIVVATKRKRIFHYFKTINDPLKHKRIEVIQTVDDCQRVVSQLQKCVS